MTQRDCIHVSVVSHGQWTMVANLLADLQQYCRAIPFYVTVILNIPERPSFDSTGCSFPVDFISNSEPRGFSANHNAAFRHGQRKYPCDYFAVVNPDIRLSSDPFPELVRCLEDNRVGVAAPLVHNLEGKVEDSARCFPTPLRILAKALGRKGPPDYEVGRGTVSPDWVAGMFMLLPAKIFIQIAGFNERYFLYYEDVDLCARLRLAGFDIRLYPSARVVHDARRQSHHSLKYLRWHIASILRFFLSRVFFSIIWKRVSNCA